MLFALLRYSTPLDAVRLTLSSDDSGCPHPPFRRIDTIDPPPNAMRAGFAKFSVYWKSELLETFGIFFLCAGIFGYPGWFVAAFIALMRLSRVAMSRCLGLGDLGWV